MHNLQLKHINHWQQHNNFFTYKSIMRHEKMISFNENT